MTAARASDPVTSHRAASENLGRSVLRRQILSALWWKWWYDDSAACASGRGYTDDELAVITGRPANVVARRRRDLVDAPTVLGMLYPLVYDTGYTRPTRTGHDAIVWRASLHGWHVADRWAEQRTPDELLRLGANALGDRPRCPFGPCAGRTFMNDQAFSGHLRRSHGAHTKVDQ